MFPRHHSPSTSSHSRKKWIYLGICCFVIVLFWIRLGAEDGRGGGETQFDTSYSKLVGGGINNDDLKTANNNKNSLLNLNSLSKSDDILKKPRGYLTLWTEPGISFAVQSILGELEEWTEISDANKAHLLWIRNDDALNWTQFRYNNEHGHRQWVNRLNNESVLSTKGALAHTIASYSSQHQNRLKLRVPRTFIMSDLAQCQEFNSILRENNNIGDNGMDGGERKYSNYWIMKETHSARGVGASIHTTAELIANEEISKCHAALNPEYDSEGVIKGHVMQEYVANPLLLNGYKSELRFYWLMISVQPWIAVMYPNATVRRTSHKYSLDDLSNLKIHLANLYQQKQGTVDVDLDSLKWTLPRLEDYLISQGKAEKGWTEKKLRPMARDYLYEVFMAGRPLMDPWDGTFGFFGADLLLDENLNMYLLEIQGSPGMAYTGVKKDIIPPLVRATADLLLEINQRKAAGLSLCTKQISAMSPFILIHNDADHECENN